LEVAYVLEAECLHLTMDGETLMTIPGDGALGIFVDTDGRHERSVGGILKHGEAEEVRCVYRQHWAALQRTNQLAAAINKPGTVYNGHARNCSFYGTCPLSP
jgi:hypothetical protein